jgi:hypothetical protein
MQRDEASLRHFGAIVCQAASLGDLAEYHARRRVAYFRADDRAGIADGGGNYGRYARQDLLYSKP